MLFLFVFDLDATLPAFTSHIWLFLLAALFIRKNSAYKGSAVASHTLAIFHQSDNPVRLSTYPRAQKNCLRYASSSMSFSTEANCDRIDSLALFSWAVCRLKHGNMLQKSSKRTDRASERERERETHTAHTHTNGCGVKKKACSFVNTSILNELHQNVCKYEVERLMCIYV